MRKATSTILAALIVAVVMAMSAGPALAGWAWDDSVPASPPTVVGPGSGKADKGMPAVSKKGPAAQDYSGKGRK